MERMACVRGVNEEETAAMRGRATEGEAVWTKKRYTEGKVDRLTVGSEKNKQ